MGFEAFKHNDGFIRISRMLNLVISVPAAGRFSWKGRNRLPENRLFVVTGPRHRQGGIIINHSDNGSKHILEAGYTYFMPRDLDLEFEFAPGFELGAFHFSLELFSGWDVFAGYRECRRLKSQPDLSREFMTLMYADDIRFDHAIGLHGICFRLIAPFCPEDIEDVQKAYLLRERYGRMLEYIRNHADARTGIEELAEVAAMSRDRLSRLFSRDAGIPLKKYLERELIRQASHILISGKTVREAAEMLNFSSEYYFSRFFRKHTGSPPARYRKEVFPR